MSLTQIQSAMPEHAAQLSALHRHVFARGWHEETFKRYLINPTICTHFASFGDEASLAGFMMARKIEEEAEIFTLAVRPTLRRQGIGRALCLASIDELSKCGIKRLFLEVNEENLPARKLYYSLGFTEVGYRKAYYQNTAGLVAGDAVTMALDFSESCEIRL